VLNLQSEFVSKLNSMIQKSLRASFLKGFTQPLLAKIMGNDNVSELERTTQSPLIFMHSHSSFLKKNTDVSNFIETHIKVRKMLHNGGCPRNYSGCPVGFRAGSAGCEPAASYNGFCGAHNFDSMSTAGKEDWAWRCGTSWACA